MHKIYYATIVQINIKKNDTAIVTELYVTTKNSHQVHETRLTTIQNPQISMMQHIQNVSNHTLPKKKKENEKNQRTSVDA